MRENTRKEAVVVEGDVAKAMLHEMFGDETADILAISGKGLCDVRQVRVTRECEVDALFEGDDAWTLLAKRRGHELPYYYYAAQRWYKAGSSKLE